MQQYAAPPHKPSKNRANGAMQQAGHIGMKLAKARIVPMVRRGEHPTMRNCQIGA